MIFIHSLLFIDLRPEYKMGKLRKKHNWKGRHQSDTQQPADEAKTDVVVELQGRNSCTGKIFFAPQY